MALIFYVNGQRIEETSFSVNQTLAQFLRDRLFLRGCKIGCGQGVCGSCTVLLSSRHGDSVRHEAVNACLMPLPACHMKAVTTVEALGSVRTRLEPLQSALAKGHAVQCGFCTPGFVMSAYALLRNRGGTATDEELERALRGNLCRCTGYRPIVQALRGICCGGDCCQNSVSTNREDNGLDDNLNIEKKSLDKTQELIFPPNLLKSPSAQCTSFRISSPTLDWVVPPDWAEAEKELRKNQNYAVIGGNTLQPLKSTRDTKTSVLDLRNIKEFISNSGKVIIGAGLTLGELERHIRNLAASDIRNGFHAALLEILDNHTSSQVKSVATVGGSIASSHRYPFFSVLLASLDSKLRVFDRRTMEIHEIAINDFDSKLAPHLVIHRVEVPLDSISRIQFFIPIDKPLRWSLCAVVRQSQKSSLSFSAAGYSEGTYKVCTVHGEFPALFDKLERIEVGDDAFRLYQGWREIFIRNMQQDGKVMKQLSPSQKLPALLTSDSVLGAPIVTDKAFEATSGEAKFHDDITPSLDELHLALVPSAHAHAKILHIDASEALKVPGVVAFISAADVPHNQYRINLPPADEEVFAENEVTFVCQPIGAIAAESPETALHAVKLVNVKYEVLPAILTIEEAEAKSSYHQSAFCSSHETTIEGGKSKTEAKFLVHGEFRIDGQEHFYMEPHSAIAIPTLEDTLTVYTGSHSPNSIQDGIAQILNLPVHNIEVRVMRIGGSFGGKEFRAGIAAFPAAVAAYKLRRPVRLVLTRDMDIRISGGRHPFNVKYDIAVENGKIEGIWFNAGIDGGATADASPLIRNSLLYKCQNGYRVPNYRYNCVAYKTNRASNTAFRAFGGPQGIMTTEMAIEHAALALGLSPEDVREKSFPKYGEKDHLGSTFSDENLRRCFLECKEKADYLKRKEEIDKFNHLNKDTKRGMALIPVSHGIGYSKAFLNQGSALVNIYHGDGSIILHHAGIEMGQGIDVKMQQVAAHVLGLPLNLFRNYPFSTNIMPNVSPTAASATTDLVGPAVIDACKTLMTRLKWNLVDGESLEERRHRWRSTVFNAYMSKVDLSARGFFSHPKPDFSAKIPGGYIYQTYGAACSEVELNCLTGEYILSRVDIVMDVGKSLNPAVDIGQIEGGFTQGYGYYCKERLNFTPQDGLPDHVVYDYTIPTVSDIPQYFNVHLLTDSENKHVHAVYSSKGVGEPPLVLGNSVYFALRRALQAIQPSNKTFIRIDCPATTDRVRKAIEEIKATSVSC